MNAELMRFTREALEKNIGRAEIGTALKQAGWADNDIRAALNSYPNISFPIPVPKSRPYLSAREGFLYLVLFSLLYAINYNLGSLVFDFINRLFPDSTQARSMYGMMFDQTRWNISSLIIILPVFLFCFYQAHKALAADPSRRDARPRKWLTYISLYFFALLIIGDFVTLLNNMLGGELTIRFALKFLTVAIIGGGNFSYFLWDISREEKS